MIDSKEKGVFFREEKARDGAIKEGGLTSDMGSGEAGPRSDASDEIILSEVIDRQSGPKIRPGGDDMDTRATAGEWSP